MSSNGNENTAGPDSEEPQAHRASGAGSARGRDAAPGAGQARPYGIGGYDPVLEALLRARRDGSVSGAGAGLGAGPEPETGLDDTPLRSRGGGVNQPRAVVPTPLLAAEAARLVDAAHTKRARMVTAIGLPAVFLAASGVAVMPTVANAASSSSTPTATSNSCAPGSAAVANPAAPKTSAPTSAPSSAPTSAPSSSSTKGDASPKTPGTPQPTSGPTTPQQSAPAPRPSSAPSGTTAPAPKPSPTSVPSSPTPKSPTSSAPTSTPSPSSSVTWWNPISWLGTTVDGVFNPAPTSSSSSSNSTVNKLAVPNAAPTSAPTSSAPTLAPSSSGPTTPPTTPSSNPTTPVVPQPTSSGSKPSAPTSSQSSKPSAPSSSTSSSPLTVNGTTIPPAAATVCVKAAADQPYREIEWHLDASSLTLNNQHFDGFQQIATGDGKTVTVMAVHADSIQLTDMVTYNEDGGRRVYSNGGKGKTVTLTNVELHVLQQKGTLLLPIPLGPVTLGPPGEAGTDLASQLAMLALESNISLGPTVMTDVHVDQYTMTSDTLNIPGFNVNAPAS